MHNALCFASPEQPILSDHIPSEMQETPWDFDIGYDFDQWVDPELPDLDVPDWAGSADLIDWTADIPDALGSSNAGPIR